MQVKEETRHGLGGAWLIQLVGEPFPMEVKRPGFSTSRAMSDQNFRRRRCTAGGEGHEAAQMPEPPDPELQEGKIPNTKNIAG